MLPVKLLGQAQHMHELIVVCIKLQFGQLRCRVWNAFQWLNMNRHCAQQTTTINAIWQLMNQIELLGQLLTNLGREDCPSRGKGLPYLRRALWRCRSLCNRQC